MLILSYLLYSYPMCHDVSVQSLFALRECHRTHILVASNDNAKGSPPLTVAEGIPRPLQNVVWNALEMRKLAALFLTVMSDSCFMKRFRQLGQH